MSIEIPTYYGFDWAKQKPNPKFCIESVHETGRGVGFHQCNRKRGFGPEGLYCKQHDPAYRAQKDAARQAEWDADCARRNKDSNDRIVGKRLFESNPELYAQILKGDPQ